MNKFSAEGFFKIGSLLGSIYLALDIKKSQANARFTDLDMPNVRKWVSTIGAECKKISLIQSSKFSDRLIANDLQRDLDAGILAAKIDDLKRLIGSEMEDCLFLHVNAEHVKYYSQPEPLFGEAVADSFPSAAYEISEAGKCIALNRNTAAVCHLMRVLEFGLRALAVRLKVTYENKPWNYVIEVADKRLKKVREQKRKPKGWKTAEKFYSEALAHFRFLKDAWRNYSMHIYERYDPESAEMVFVHTRAFMLHLATKLKEAS